MSLEEKLKVKKLLSILMIFMPVTAAKREVVENAGAIKDGGNLKINLLQVLSI